MSGCGGVVWVGWRDWMLGVAKEPAWRVACVAGFGARRCPGRRANVKPTTAALGVGAGSWAGTDLGAAEQHGDGGAARQVEAGDQLRILLLPLALHKLQGVQMAAAGRAARRGDWAWGRACSRQKGKAAPPQGGPHADCADRLLYTRRAWQAGPRAWAAMQLPGSGVHACTQGAGSRPAGGCRQQALLGVRADRRCQPGRAAAAAAGLVFSPPIFEF